MNTSPYRIVNIEHVNTLPGEVGQPHDRAIVIDESRTERHIITGKPQPLTVYRGTLQGAHEYVCDRVCKPVR